MKLTEIIVKNAIVPDLQAKSRDDAIRELVGSLANAGAIAQGDVDEIVIAIVKREKSGSTGFGKGVAVPHVKHALVKKMAGTVGRSINGLDFASLDKQPVYSIFVLLSPENNTQHHAAMNRIFTNLQNDTFRKFLRQSDSQDKIFDLLEEADQKAQ